MTSDHSAEAHGMSGNTVHCRSTKSQCEFRKINETLAYWVLKNDIADERLTRTTVSARGIVYHSPAAKASAKPAFMMTDFIVSVVVRFRW